MAKVVTFHSEPEMRGLDAAADEARQALRLATQAAFNAAGKRVLFVDSAEILGRHDVKNGMGGPFIEPGTGREYDNRCIGDLGLHRVRGGICGLDNFHPTTRGRLTC